MPVDFQLKDHYLYKLGYKEGKEEYERNLIVKKHKNGEPSGEIANYLGLSLARVQKVITKNQ